MYMYLNKSHENLLPKLVEALREMKKDGAYKKIYDGVFLPLSN